MKMRNMLGVRGQNALRFYSGVSRTAIDGELYAEIIVEEYVVTDVGDELREGRVSTFTVDSQQLNWLIGKLQDLKIDMLKVENEYLSRKEEE